jgi:hypothetical protein
MSTGSPPVIDAPLLVVREHLVGITDGFELVLCTRLLVHIWVELASLQGHKLPTISQDSVVLTASTTHAAHCHTECLSTQSAFPWLQCRSTTFWRYADLIAFLSASLLTPSAS